VDTVRAFIGVSSIDFDDDTFSITYGYNPDRLKVSLERVGLINPPVVRPVSRGRYQIVCGFQRMKILAHAGLDSIPAALLSLHVCDRDAFLLALYDNLSHRHFNPVEKSMVLNKLCQFFAIETILDEYHPLLDLPPLRPVFDQYCSMLSLEPRVKEAVASGRFREKLAFKLVDLPWTHRAAVASLLLALRLTKSEQEEVVTNIVEIVRRERISIEELLRAEEVGRALSCERWSSTQKGQRIRDYLRRRRYPRITQAEERFKGLCRKLNLPKHIRLEPSPRFEEGPARVSIECDTHEQLKQSLGTLSSLLAKPEFKDLLEGN
jgi:hypothetical protein